jgi:protein-tyrosine-phosphatase
MFRVLIVCEGDTSRSPTLALLLSHVAHRLGHKDHFVSAGFSISASEDERRMRFPRGEA